MTPRIHLLLMALVGAISSFLVAWISDVVLTGWSIIVYHISYGDASHPKGVRSPLWEHLDLFPWCTQFVWQHSVSLAVLSFLTCLGLVGPYAWWRPKDVRGQWLILLTVCLLLQVFVSLSMALPLSDVWKLGEMMHTYLKLRHNTTSGL